MALVLMEARFVMKRLVWKGLAWTIENGRVKYLSINFKIKYHWKNNGIISTTTYRQQHIDNNKANSIKEVRPSSGFFYSKKPIHMVRIGKVCQRQQHKSFAEQTAVLILRRNSHHTQMLRISFALFFTPFSRKRNCRSKKAT